MDIDLVFASDMEVTFSLKGLKANLSQENRLFKSFVIQQNKYLFYISSWFKVLFSKSKGKTTKLFFVQCQ